MGRQAKNFNGARILSGAIFLLILCASFTLYPVNEAHALAVDCSTCHVPIAVSKHSAAHDKAGVPLDFCSATCHTTDIPAVHDSITATEGMTDPQEKCTICHKDDASLDAVIARGVAGNFVDCFACHDVADPDPLKRADHLSLHDNFGVAGQCADCHNVDGATILTVHMNNCELCHGANVTNTGVANALLKGSSNVDFDCNECHSAHEPVTAHNFFTTSAACDSCHVSSNFSEIDSLHNDNCLTCHGTIADSQLADLVALTIEQGKGGTPVKCENCHSAMPIHDGSAVHNNLSTSTLNNCSDCHNTSTFDLILTAHKSDCVTCHDPNVRADANAAIVLGKGPAGQPVTCDNCHAMHDDGPGLHNNLSADNLLLIPLCTGCHIVSNFDEIYTVHLDCVTCHTSERPDVIAAINTAKGDSVTHVNCESCHTAHDGPVDHNNVILLSDCTVCHNGVGFVGLYTIHNAKGGDCVICHSSTRPEVVAAIDSAKGDSVITVDCSDCHNGHSGDHNNLSSAGLVTQPLCTKCHVVSSFDEIYTAHKGDCTLCHNSTRQDVQDAIVAGSNDPGTPVNCESCHEFTTAHDANNVHNKLDTDDRCSDCHFSSNFVSTLITHNNDCVLCHANDRTDPAENQQVNDTIAAGIAGTSVNCLDCHKHHDGQHNEFILPTGLDCSNCHVSVTFPDVIGLHVDCAVCHNSPRPDVQDTIADGSFGMMSVNCDNCHSNASHESAHTINKSNDCSGCHDSENYDQILVTHRSDCETCHSSTRQQVIDTIAAGPNPTDCYDCHTAHNDTLAHDYLNTVLSCDECHPSATIPEIMTTHLNDCTICHDSTVPEVMQAITDGRNKINVDCRSCHGDDEHGSAHTRTALTDPDVCGECHVANVATEHVTNGNIGCVDCHSSTDPLVIAAIAKTGTVICADCHGATDHANAHNQTFTTPQPSDCISCHYANAATEHMTKLLNFECSNCHSSTRTEVIATIASGSGDPGNPVYCFDCHLGFVDHSNVQHLMTSLPSPDCSECHDTDVAAEHVTKRGFACTVCHGDPQYADEINEGKLGTSLTCADCHDPVVNEHPAAHDMTDTDPDGCIDCHDPNVAIEHVDKAMLTCDTCHTSKDPLVVAAIASGKADNTVLCSACHKDITGHESAHDMTRFPADTTIACVDCHVENVVTEHADTDCSTCHDPNNPKYAAAIASGRDGNIVECTACHVGLDHTNSITHDTDVPQNGCLNCHSANVVVEHVDKRDISCLACHKTAYQAIINEGVAGTLITCDRCHATPDHHSNTNATNGNCNHCHAVPTTKSESPVQGACRECHINSNGYVQGLNPTRTVHSYNTTGYIQDFGACLSCHDVTPYHAKPNSWPGWYEENGDAPGRGTFNIFMSEFKPSRTGEGSTMEGRSGYGEGGRPSRDQDRNWRNSSISFNMTRVNHNGTNYDVPTFDNGTPVHNNVGDGGSYEPPPPINTACDVDPAGTYVEAEDYNVGGNNWSLRTDLSSANGGTYLYATYNSSSYSPGGSPAEYDLNFTETGTYRIWFRGRDNGSSGDNSLWYGVDGSMVGNVQTPSSTNTTWDWARDRDGSGPSYAQIQINSTGTYSITVWAKENGMRFDGFYITKATGSISSSNPIPSGAKVIDPANCN